MEQSSAETVLRFPSEVVRYWMLWLRFWSFPDEKNEKWKDLSFHWLMLPTAEIFHLTVSLFFPSFPSNKKKKNIFSLVITRVNFYQHLLMKLQKRCYATAAVQKFRCNFSRNHFPTCSLYCNSSVPQSLPIFIYIYSNQLYLPCLHVLKFL